MRRIVLAPQSLAPVSLIAVILIGNVVYHQTPMGATNSSETPPPFEISPQLFAQSGNESDASKSLPSKPVKATLVGRKVCGECHAENFQLHSRHGHASTFHYTADTDLPERFDGQKIDTGFGTGTNVGSETEQDFGTYEYERDSTGKLFVTLKSEFGDDPFPLPYTLGSRLHAQTLLTLIPGLDGQTEGIEHRFSCFADGSIALTPGHAKKRPGSSLELFGALATGEPLQRCIYCHTTQGTVTNGGIEGLISNVNCEKCHGPGSEHVRLARENKKPPPYSIGQQSWDPESELQLCGDCHRLPRNVSEKEVREYPDSLIRFQPIGMTRSRCFLGSKTSESVDEMKCTTCHNPHQSLQELKEADHVNDCLQCHQTGVESHVTCPVNSETGCIECHMPAVELDQIRFHDHWIRVHKD